LVRTGSHLLLLAVSLLSLAVFVPAAQAGFPVELTVQNPNTANWTALPVTSGVPFLRGQVKNPSQLSLQDSAGNPVPAQFVPIMTYNDGSARWVLVDFQPTVAAGASEVYRIVRNGTAAAHPTPIQITQDANSMTVSTGAAVFTMSKSNFNLFDSVTVGGVPVVSSSPTNGISVTKASDGSVWHSNFGPATFTIEDQGPMHTVVKVVGDHRRFAGDASHLLEYTCRIHFYAGQSLVRVFYRLENAKAAQHPGNRWDSGWSGYEDITDASLQLRTNLVPTVSYMAQGNAGSAPMTGTVAGSTYLYQCSSGGAKWNHDHHMDRYYNRYHLYTDAFSGWRLINNNQTVASGSRAIGWMAFNDANIGVSAGMRHFWQNCPKAIELSQEAVEAGWKLCVRPFPKYWTSHHGFEFEGGLNKTTECFFYFHTGAGNAQEVMAGLNAPLFARCTQAHYADTFAFEYLGAYNPTSYPRLEGYTNNVINSITGNWENFDEYGWEDFGCVVADHEMGTLPIDPVTGKNWKVDGINHYGNEYFASEGFMIQFARRGNLQFLDSAIAQSRHMLDIHIYHVKNIASDPAYAGGYFLHTTHDMPALRAKHRIYPGECDSDRNPQLDQLLYPLCPNDIFTPTYNSGGPGDPGHLNTPYYYYFLTGDRMAYDSILESTQWSLRAGVPTSRGRESGNFLFSLTYGYQLTHDVAYRNKIFATLAANTVQASMNWSTSWYIDGIARFILWKRLNGEFDADYNTAVSHAISWSNTYLNNYVPSSSYWHYHDFDALALLYLSLPETHANRPLLLAKADADKADAESQVPGWYQSKDLSVLTNAGCPHMFIKEGRIPPHPPGDITGDGHVNVFDLQKLAAAWNTREGDANYNAQADLNQDGKIDVFDLQVMAINWNKV